MPENWAAALGAATTGVTDAMAMVTGSAILTALTFGFIFLKKAISVVKKLIRLGGAN